MVCSAVVCSAMVCSVVGYELRGGHAPTHITNTALITHCSLAGISSFML